MLSLAHLMTDVEGSVERGSGDDRARTLSRITDLFVRGAAGFQDEQVELFDAVIQRFAAAIEIRARIELAERLAKLANAPPGVIEALARDEIAVARPVLTTSARLNDQILMAVAIERGRDHMLAICERETISPIVTDLLVEHGDGVVRHAVVGNQGARLSPRGAASLIRHARQDEALGELLGERTDLSPFEAKQLVEIAKERARQRIMPSLPGAASEVAGAVERGATAMAGHAVTARDYGTARSVVDAVLRSRELAEADLAGFAGEGRLEETISSIAFMTGLSIPCIERIFEERDNDLLIVIGKARGWTWRTVRELLRLRNPALTERHQFRRAEETFDGLASPTAARVLHFLKVRETAGRLGVIGRNDRFRSV